MIGVALTARNADLAGIVETLEGQRARAYDAVVPAGKLSMVNGDLVIQGADVKMDKTGVTRVDGVYTPTRIADADLANKLGIDLKYYRKVREAGRTDILDDNVNAWLHGKTLTTDDIELEVHPADRRKFLIRCFRADDGSAGVARAILSHKYRIIDNLSVLTTILGVFKDMADPTHDYYVPGFELGPDDIKVDLSDTQMYAKIKVKSIAQAAPNLLAGYRSPFGVKDVTDNDHLIFAGILVQNSEIGHGSFKISPHFTVKICDNGMTISKDATTKVHLGGELGAGEIQWSQATIEANSRLVESQTRDAVTRFLSADYLSSTITALEEDAGVEVEKPAEEIEVVVRDFKFTEDQGRTILDHFIKGHQLTAGGVMQAVTSTAQTIKDADVAADLESRAVDVMQFVAARNR